MWHHKKRTVETFCYLWGGATMYLRFELESVGGAHVNKPLSGEKKWLELKHL